MLWELLGSSALDSLEPQSHGGTLDTCPKYCVPAQRAGREGSEERSRERIREGIREGIQGKDSGNGLREGIQGKD